MNLCKITILKDSVIKGHIRSNVDFIFKKIKYLYYPVDMNSVLMLLFLSKI